MNILTDFRPEEFEDYLGANPLVTSLLAKKGGGGTLAPVLLSGPSGVGKTTLARLIGKDTTIFEYDCGNMRGIDDARKLMERHLTKPLFTDKVTLILDECHGFTTDAQTALLKFVEEPPEWVQIVLCTTHAAKVLKTLAARCYQIELGGLRPPFIKKLVERVVTQVGGDVADITAKILAANISTPRAILGAIQVLKDGGELCGSEMVGDVFKAVQELYNGNFTAMWKVLGELGNADICNFRYVAVAYGRSILLKRTHPVAIRVVKVLAGVPVLDENLTSGLIVAELRSL